MAKKSNIEEEELLKNNPAEETKEEIASTDKPAAQEATVTSSVKKVKIRVTEDIDSLIACVSYKFTKDKEYSVPSDVAAILCHANKAYRL